MKYGDVEEEGGSNRATWCGFIEAESGDALNTDMTEKSLLATRNTYAIFLAA